jgi:hypothetical protein
MMRIVKLMIAINASRERTDPTTNSSCATGVSAAIQPAYAATELRPAVWASFASNPFCHTGHFD